MSKSKIQHYFLRHGEIWQSVTYVRCFQKTANFFEGFQGENKKQQHTGHLRSFKLIFSPTRWVNFSLSHMSRSDSSRSLDGYWKRGGKGKTSVCKHLMTTMAHIPTGAKLCGVKGGRSKAPWWMQQRCSLNRTKRWWRVCVCGCFCCFWNRRMIKVGYYEVLDIQYDGGEGLFFFSQIYLQPKFNSALSSTWTLLVDSLFCKWVIP